jgi:hypothetical protein
MQAMRIDLGDLLIGNQPSGDQSLLYATLVLALNLLNGREVLLLDLARLEQQIDEKLPPQVHACSDRHDPTPGEFPRA